MSKELKESGGGDEEQSELERLVEELVTLRDESDKRADDQSEAKKEAMANEKKQAIEMRERALERFGETRKRNDDEQEAEKKTTKRRRTGGEAMEWLKEKAEVLRQVKEEEMKEKREERESQKLHYDLVSKQVEATQKAQAEQSGIFQRQILQQMQQQQQQQQQQQFAMMQQQTQLLANLAKKDE